jgi:ribosomal protein S18 acetylase RimI-like enzyme
MIHQEATMIELRTLEKRDGFEDLIALSRIFFEEYQDHHREFFKIDELKDEDIIRYFANLRDQEDGDVVIALDGNRIVGYITYYVKTQSDQWVVKKVGNISGLMVHPAYRRQGIANQLLARAKTYFQLASIKYFWVYTAVNNQRAISFYESNGLNPLHTTLLGETQDP